MGQWKETVHLEQGDFEDQGRADVGAALGGISPDDGGGATGRSTSASCKDFLPGKGQRRGEEYACARAVEPIHASLELELGLS